ncbi:MAG: periplasmic heavy metal sensor [Spirochaetes bacterium]|nr:periplasmic heavy metal sensor [Spirochaetota bacterium]
MHTMKSIYLPLGMAIAAAMLFATALPAQPCMDGDGPGPRGKGGPPRAPIFFGNPGMMKKQLGLSDDQITRIGEINLRYKKQMLDQREKLAPKEIQLERLLLEDSPDLGNVRKTLREISDVKLEIQMLKVSHRLEIEKVLTREQKSKLREMRPPRRGGPGGPGDMRRGGQGRKGPGGPGYY